MSLVHEALRKAEREKQRKAGVAPAAPVQPLPSTPAPSAPTHQPVPHAPITPTAVASTIRAPAPHPTPGPTEQPRETNHLLLSALIGCVAIVAIIAIVFLVSNASSVLHQAKSTTPASAPTASTPVAASPAPSSPTVATPPSADVTPAPSAPAPVMADESLYKISGIMNDPDGKPVAVINGRVAYEGYYIDGATIDKIEPDRVTLDIKGQKELLRLH